MQEQGFKRPCEHGRQRRLRSTCKECGGCDICEHGRRRTACKECSAGSIRKHGCGSAAGAWTAAAAAFCEHGRYRIKACKECGGGSRLAGTCTCTCTCTCTSTCTCTCTSTCNMHMYNMYMCMCMHMHMCMYMCNIYVCMYVYIFACTNMARNDSTRRTLFYTLFYSRHWTAFFRPCSSQGVLHSLQQLRSRLCSQMLPPPHSLHRLRCRLKKKLRGVCLSFRAVW